MGKTAAIIIDKCHIGWIYLYFCNVDKSLVLFLKGAIAIGCSPRAKNKCSLHTGSFEIIYDLCDEFVKHFTGVLSAISEDLGIADG